MAKKMTAHKIDIDPESKYGAWIVYDKITCEVSGEMDTGEKVWTELETGEQYFCTRMLGTYYFFQQ